MCHVWISIRRCNVFPCRKIEIKRNFKIFGDYIPIIEIIVNGEAKSWPKHIPSLEYAITVYFKCSFLLASRIKTCTCIMAISVPTLLTFNSSLLETITPYRFPMGSLLGIGGLNIIISFKDPKLVCSKSFRMIW